jgi:hypothetical protein
VREGVPVVICLSDQNFASKFAGSGVKTCISVIRIEDASLAELVDILVDMMGGVKFPPGSIVLMGSVTYLHGLGVENYAREWVAQIERMGKVWEGVNVCPLFPVTGESLPGSLGVSLLELGCWFATVYENGILGLRGPWNAFLGSIPERLGGNEVVNLRESRVALPTALKGGAPLSTFVF